MSLTELAALIVKEAPELEPVVVSFVQSILAWGKTKAPAAADVQAAETAGETSIAADDAAAEAAAKAKDATAPKAP